MTEMETRRRRRRLLIALSAVAVLALLAGAAWAGWLDKDRASVIAAFLSVIAAAASWEATGRASDTAEEARRTAEIVARIESDRWHHEITPEVNIKVNPAGYEGNTAYMHVAFVGPAIHQEIESVLLSIMDDGRMRLPGVTHGLNQEQIDAQIWGAYKFESTNDGASDDGRRVPPFVLKLGHQRDFWLTRTSGPEDYPPGNWRADYGGLPVRVRVECTVVGEARSWAYIREVQPVMR
ncbi:hypothetical protein [Streptomyces sp. NPDC005408]|uniref:hypothetical protein n=1 Tax=Streptomyces sp. NPDC005408 TaxID=3155341 RepID=UPI0033BF4612